MANKLLMYYDEAAKLGGIKAKMRLAVLTNIPSAKAEIEPDSPENIKKFEQAMQEIKKEFT
jgi:hypothetical protein